jgi:hypothetical protein
MMMNGWSNHETWNINLWLGESFEQYVEEYKAAYLEDGADLANDLENLAWELTGLGEMPIGFAFDSANDAFGRINWVELARHYQPVEEVEDFYEGDDDFAMDWEF